MDAQLKRGILDYLVLAILKDNDYYGYILMNEVTKWIDVSDFALYPILRRLESEGYLDTYSKEENGRLRKYYRINDQGLDKLAKAQEDWLIIKNTYSKILGEHLDG